MKKRLPVLVFILAMLFSTAVIAFAFFYRGLVGMHLYDMHMEEAESLNRAITRQQQAFVGLSFDYISGVYSFFLVITNIVWIATSCYLLAMFNKKSVGMTESGDRSKKA